MSPSPRRPFPWGALLEGFWVGGTLGAMIFAIVGGVIFGHVHLNAGYAAAIGLPVGGLIGAVLAVRFRRRR
ncbi:MAG: hypothetical protein ACE366_30795 [Bradymonadia bacterium]